jgi:hypothetical protein
MGEWKYSFTISSWYFYGLKWLAVGSGSRSPELYSVSPDWFEYCFMCEKFVAYSSVSCKIWRLCARYEMKLFMNISWTSLPFHECDHEKRCVLEFCHTSVLFINVAIATYFILQYSDKSRSLLNYFFFLKNPIYLQSVTIHSANGGKGQGWHVEEYSVALLC